MSLSEQMRAYLPVKRASAAALCLLFLLSACGYQPLYAKRGARDVHAETQSVKIALVADRKGQRLRNNLLDRLNPRGEPANPKYVLDVSLTETRQDIAVRKDETSTRANFILTAQYLLRDSTNGRVVFAATSRQIASFNVSDEQFSTISSANAARKRAVNTLADEIATRVAVYLNRRMAAKSKGSG